MAGTLIEAELERPQFEPLKFSCPPPVECAPCKLPHEPYRWCERAVCTGGELAGGLSMLLAALFVGLGALIVLYRFVGEMRDSLASYALVRRERALRVQSEELNLKERSLQIEHNAKKRDAELELEVTRRKLTDPFEVKS